MLGKEIKFPSNLQSLTNDGPLASRRDSNAILIYYYDGNECTSCNIANLNNIINIYQSPNLSIIPIFSINDDEHYLNLTPLLNNNSIKTIAYIDINKDFIRKNSFIPKDSKFHTFLLTYIIHSGFISGYQNRYGDNLKPPTNVYHRMTA